MSIDSNFFWSVLTIRKGEIMTDLAKEISSATVSSGSIRLWWLAQAGFVFKSHKGHIIYVDPYLSDAVERLHGFKRMSLSPIKAEEVKADLIINTHEHTDHLDPDALPMIVKNNPHCKFAGSLSCEESYRQFGIGAERCTLCDSLSFLDVY